jgi:transcriptional regulator with XRE-family HTH domain
LKGIKAMESVDCVKKSGNSSETTCFLKLVGANMRKYRKEKKMTQAQLAKTLHMAFVSYNNIERGIVGTTLRTLFKIAKVLEVSPTQLLLGKDELFLTKKEIASLCVKEAE